MDIPLPGRRTWRGVGIYVRDPRARILHVVGLLVLTLAGDRICAMTRFDTSVLASFGLPRILPD